MGSEVLHLRTWCSRDVVGYLVVRHLGSALEPTDFRVENNPTLVERSDVLVWACCDRSKGEHTNDGTVPVNFDVPQGTPCGTVMLGRGCYTLESEEATHEDVCGHEDNCVTMRPLVIAAAAVADAAAADV